MQNGHRRVTSKILSAEQPRRGACALKCNRNDSQGQLGDVLGFEQAQNLIWELRKACPGKDFKLRVGIEGVDVEVKTPSLVDQIVGWVVGIIRKFLCL